jgi:hypothetical protein
LDLDLDLDLDLVLDLVLDLDLDRNLDHGTRIRPTGATAKLDVPRPRCNPLDRTLVRYLGCPL